MFSMKQKYFCFTFCSPHSQAGARQSAVVVLLPEKCSDIETPGQPPLSWHGKPKIDDMRTYFFP